MSTTDQRLREALAEIAGLKAQVQQYEHNVTNAFKLALALAAPRGCQFCQAHYHRAKTPHTFPAGTKVGGAVFREENWKHEIDVNGITYFMPCEAPYLHSLLAACGPEQITELLKGIA